MKSFVFPAKITADTVDGGFVIQFRDFPEAITQAESKVEALTEAADCLEEAIANRITTGMPIPEPSVARKQDLTVPLSAQMAAKAALYLAIRETSMTNVELASRLHCDEKEIRRLLDPHHSSKLPRIESALAAMGKRLVLGMGTI